MMKKSVWLFVFLMAGSLIFQDNLNAKNKSGEMNMKQLVDQYFAAFNRHDIDALAVMYSEDARLEGPEEPTLTVGREGIKNHYAGFFEMIPDVKDEVKNVIIGDNKIAVEFVSTGTIPTEDGSGQKFELKIASTFEIVEGKIVRDATYYDTAVTNN